jgi:hypothetical protein
VSSSARVGLNVVRAAVAQVRVLLAELEPATLSPAQAVGLVQEFATLERLAGAGRTLAAGRAASTGAWAVDDAHRDFESWLAGVSGTTVGAARATVETATRLRELPTTVDALRAGELSAVQVAEVARAAAADPGAERDLLRSAATNGVKGLRDDCGRVRAAAASAEDERILCERAIAARAVRHRKDADGLGHIEVRGPLERTAQIMADLEATERELFAEARAAGRREHPEALAFDALCRVTGGRPIPERPEGAPTAADGTAGVRRAPPGSRARPTIVFHVSHAAFVRGSTLPGEICEVAGAGPVPVAVARALAGDAILKAVVERGREITHVAHLGRTIPSHLRTYIETRDPECVIAGCHVNRHLEIDHNEPFADGGPTNAENLHRLCRYHHDHKTSTGARLVGIPGEMTFRYPPGAAGPGADLAERGPP